MTRYPHLNSPIRLGSLELPNRVVMGSMHTGLEDRTKNIPRLAEYYAERARAGIGLIVTGGYAPNREGWLLPFAAGLTDRATARKHRGITDAVHHEGGRLVLQILHAGRYSYHPLSVSASARKSPITPFRPRALSSRGVHRQIRAFVRCAELAAEGGYDGIEIMGSEGYFINQFLAERTNRRTDEWGGSWHARMRLPVEIVRRVRQAVGPDLAIIYRMSLVDYVDGGQSWDEVVELAAAVQDAGADAINTGIGWHESRVPTIVTSVPRAAFRSVTGKLKPHVRVPLIASNRINMPSTAEDILACGDADMVSLARPLLADPEWMDKAATGREDEINTCIACNQACLDHVFRHKTASCLVNPRAAHETELVIRPAGTPQRIAVAGAGPAGLAAATTLARRGHSVTLFEAGDAIGGQFNLAKRIPGKEEFHETIRYFGKQLELLGVRLRLNTALDATTARTYDRLIVATGVWPRTPSIPGIDHPKVLSYVDVINGADIGDTVAVIGAGGIGFDVAEFLTRHEPGTQGEPAPAGVEEWMDDWGVVDPALARAGLRQAPTASGQATARPPARRVTLLQRKTTKPGKELGQTTGWVHRASLKRQRVDMLTGVRYERIDDDGLHVSFAHERGRTRVLGVEHIVVCAGQESRRQLADQLAGTGLPVHVIGGADVAAELDAKRAIAQGTRLAASL